MGQEISKPMSPPRSSPGDFVIRVACGCVVGIEGRPVFRLTQLVSKLPGPLRKVSVRAVAVAARERYTERNGGGRRPFVTAYATRSRTGGHGGPTGVDRS